MVYKKKQIKSGRYLYAFNDAKKLLPRRFLIWQMQRRKALSPKRVMQRSKEVFGTIVLESDQDLEPKAAYL